MIKTSDNFKRDLLSLIFVILVVLSFGYWLYDSLQRGNWKEFLIVLTIFIFGIITMYERYQNIKKEDE